MNDRVLSRIATVILIVTFAILGWVLLSLIHSNYKREHDQMIQSASTDTVAQAPVNAQMYAFVTEEGKVTVINIAGDTIWRGDIHDTLRKPCVRCRAGSKGRLTCKQLEAENGTLRKLLNHCSKGN